MKIVIDNAIPFLEGVLEPYAEIRYLPGREIAARDVRDADARIVRTRTRCDAALLDEFAECFDAAFPPESRLHTDGFYSAYNNRMNPITHYSGITISEPSTKFTEENRATNWYRVTHE